jgi:hypothetical protein
MLADEGINLRRNLKEVVSFQFLGRRDFHRIGGDNFDLEHLKNSFVIIAAFMLRGLIVIGHRGLAHRQRPLSADNHPLSARQIFVSCEPQSTARTIGRGVLGC